MPIRSRYQTFYDYYDHFWTVLNCFTISGLSITKRAVHKYSHNTHIRWWSFISKRLPAYNTIGLKCLLTVAFSQKRLEIFFCCQNKYSKSLSWAEDLNFPPKTGNNLPYVRHYKPRLVYFLPHLQRSFLCF